MSDARVEPTDDTAIAIVGMSGRFPGASDVGTFWSNIRNGVESITHFAEHELAFPPPPATGPDGSAGFVRAKGMLADVDMFDARFFGYPPREAEVMDPQQRLFLECAWEALEQAGCDPERYPGSIGVYAGCYVDTYLLDNLCSDPEFLRNLVESIQVGSLQTELGNDKDYLATRVAFKLNLRGPAVTVQTACSTSLVAICHACDSLATFQSDMVLAGGATIVLPQAKGYSYTEGGMLSPDGHCRAFSDRAAGTVFSNGVAAILMKRLPDAIEDGDTIYAVIRGWATNNDGGSKLSYTAPSVDGQAEVITRAQALAGIDARTIGYVEAHGTATPLGDPIEVAGLTRAFRQTTADNGFCALGSVKTNLGHLDVASGVIGTIKTALSLHERIIPPTLHYERPNPRIDFGATPFFVNAASLQWGATPWPRRAGVSSFGVGGTNAHLVLEEAPPREREAPSPDACHLLPLSARTPTALAAMAQRLAAHLDENPGIRLDDVARTLQVGRRHFDHRRSVVCSTAAEAVAALRSEPTPAALSHQQQTDVPVAFMFTGQGSQYPDMARELYEADSAFRADVDACAEILREPLGFDLRQALFPTTAAAADAAERLRQTEIAQPAIFTIGYALARHWLRLGVTPDVLVGHSVGEFTAACIAGVFELEDALGLVAERGRLMQAQPPGGMLSVRAPADRVAELLPAGLALAAVNAPSLCVVAGPDRELDSFAERLDAAGIAHTRLHTSHAFHSTMMEPVVAPLMERMRTMKLTVPGIEIRSTATGATLSPEDAVDPAYWGRQLRQTVQFAPVIEQLAGEGSRIYLEVGAGQTLTTLVRQTVRSDDVTAIPSLGPVQAPGSDTAQITTALGRLWLAGADIDWAAVTPADACRVPLPTYPFERKRFWVEPKRSAARAAAGAAQEAEPAHAASTDVAAATSHAAPTDVAAATSHAAANGGPAAHGSVDPEADIGALVARQIEVMRRQLAALAGQ